MNAALLSRSLFLGLLSIGLSFAVGCECDDKQQREKICEDQGLTYQETDDGEWYCVKTKIKVVDQTCAEAAEGTLCNDGNACTFDDVCQDKVCVGTELTGIDDNNPCTEDSCNPDTGEIVHDGAPLDNEGCDDGDSCSNNDVCLGGLCSGDYTVDVNGDPIDDGDACTRDFCDDSGVRHNEPLTFEEAAARGLGGLTIEDAANPCLSYVCVVGSGDTPHADPLSAVSCADPDAGRSNGACVNWQCQAGQCTAVINEDVVEGADITVGLDLHPHCRMRECDTRMGEVRYVPDPRTLEFPCDDDNDCSFADLCLADGSCTGTQVAHGTDCDDDNACTQGDYCHEGACRSGTDQLAATVEADPEGLILNAVECKVYACDPQLGVVVGQVTDGTSCDDSNPCTSSSECQGGECVGVRDNNNDGDVCVSPSNACEEGYCDKGVCIAYRPLPDGTSCPSPNPCENWTCEAQSDRGVCTYDNDVADDTVCGQVDDCRDLICSGGNCIPDTNLTRHDGDSCGEFDVRCNVPECQNSQCRANPATGSACALVPEDLSAFGLAAPDLACNTGECRVAGGVGVCEPVAANADSSCDNQNPCDGEDWCQTQSNRGHCQERYTTDDVDNSEYDNAAPDYSSATQCNVDDNNGTEGRCKFDGTCVEISSAVDDVNSCTRVRWDEALDQLVSEALPDQTSCHVLNINPCLENRGVCLDGECHVNPEPDGTSCDVVSARIPPAEDLPSGHRQECYAEVCIEGSCVLSTSWRNGSLCDDGETVCSLPGLCQEGACQGRGDGRGYGETCLPSGNNSITTLDGQPVAAKDVGCYSVFECAEDGSCSVAVAPVSQSAHLPCDYDLNGDTCDGECDGDGICEQRQWASSAGHGAVTCNDDEPCTEDSCNGSGSCENSAYNDGSRLGCQGVDPNNSCADMECQSGSCVSEANTGRSCDDGNSCTTGDQCQSGSCVAGNNASAGTACDLDHSDDDCIRNVCDSSGNCSQAENEPNNSPCNTDDPCTLWGCADGQCEPRGFSSQQSDGTNCDSNDIPCDEACLDPDGASGDLVSRCVPFNTFYGLLDPEEMAANGDQNTADGWEEQRCRELYDPTFDITDGSGGHSCARFVCHYGACRLWSDELPAGLLADNPTDGDPCRDSGECTAHGVCQGSVCVSYNHLADGQVCGVSSCNPDGDTVNQNVCQAGACTENTQLVASCSRGIDTCQASQCADGGCPYQCQVGTYDYINAFEDISNTGDARRNRLRSPLNTSITCGNHNNSAISEEQRLACDDGSVLLDLQDDLGFASPDGDAEGFWFFNRRYRYISISVNGAIALHKDNPASLSEDEDTLFVSGNVGGARLNPDAGDAPGDPVNDGDDAAQIRVFHDDLTFVSDLTEDRPGSSTQTYGAFTSFGNIYTEHMPGPDGTAGSPEDDYLIVQWEDAAFYGCADNNLGRAHMTFQLKWWPSTGRMVFVYPANPMVPSDDGPAELTHCLPGRTAGSDASVGLVDEGGNPSTTVASNTWIIRNDSGLLSDRFDDFYMLWPKDKPTTQYGWRGWLPFVDLSGYQSAQGNSVGHRLDEVSDCDSCCQQVQFDQPIFFDGEPRHFMNVCADGYVHFMDHRAAHFVDHSLDNSCDTVLNPTESPDVLIAPFWSDLRTALHNHSNIYWLDRTADAGRQIIVQWNLVDYAYRTDRSGLAPAEQERGETMCNDNNNDEDGDGLTDCDDPSCSCAVTCGGQGCGLTFELIYHVGTGVAEFRYQNPEREFVHAESSARFGGVANTAVSSGMQLERRQGSLWRTSYGVDLLDGINGGDQVQAPGNNFQLHAADVDEQMPRQQLNVLLAQQGWLTPYALANAVDQQYPQPPVDNSVHHVDSDFSVEPAACQGGSNPDAGGMDGYTPSPDAGSPDRDSADVSIPDFGFPDFHLFPDHYTAPDTVQPDAAGGQIYSDIDAFDQVVCAVAPTEIVCRSQSPLWQRVIPGLFAKVSVGANFVCGLDFDNRVTCYDPPNAPQPAINQLFRELDSYGDHLCGLQTNHQPACFGGFIEPPSPGLGEAGTLSTGNQHACVTYPASPIMQLSCSQILTGWNAFQNVTYSKLASGESFTCGINESNNIDCFGLGTPLNGIPVGSFVDLGCGREHCCAMDATGLMSCWGENSSGQCAAPLTAGWAKVVGTGTYTCALSNTGAIQCWGVASPW